MTTLGAATTRHRCTERKLSGRQKKNKKTKYLPVLTWGKGWVRTKRPKKAELAQKTTQAKWFDLHGRAVNYWSPWINPKTAPTSGTNRWPANIVSSLTLPKFQLATFTVLTTQNDNVPCASENGTRSSFLRCWHLPRSSSVLADNSFTFFPYNCCVASKRSCCLGVSLSSVWN